MKLKFDGSITVNPGGKVSCGYVLYDEEGFLIDKGTRVVGEGEGMTVNTAEYEGLLMGLRAAILLLEENESLLVQGDSQLIIKQVKLEWKAKKQHLRKLRDEVLELLIKGRVRAEFQWIPREENVDADVMGV